MATAIELVALSAAYALGINNVTGSLEAGKSADFVLTDQNIFDIDWQEIEDAQFFMTMSGGQIVYSVK